MLAIFLSWIIISFISFSLGDILLFAFNKICKKDEEYNFIDVCILGICFITALVSVSSIWLASNHWILFFFLTVSVLHWVLQRKRLGTYLELFRKSLAIFKSKDWIFLSLSITSILTYVLWASFAYDPTYYHYQNIHWNEEYPAVYGLGNLEDRFGFNSNYFLLSAVFTLRFIFGEPIYGVISVIFIWLVCWILFELIKSKYELKRIILLVLFLIFYITNSSSINDSVADTSTDTIPSIFIFYLFARLILYPDSLKKSYLLYIAVPVSLITFKLSSGVVSLISLYILFTLIKEKDYKTVFFTCVLSLLILIPWLVRNVIISGYLIYPIHEINIFSFDWQVPESVAVEQRGHMKYYALLIFNKMIKGRFFTEDPTFIFSAVIALILLIYSLVVLSPLAVVYRLMKKREINKNIYIAYGVLMASIVAWFVSAPDYRFACGSLISIAFFSLVLLFDNGKEKLLPKAGNIVLLFFTLIIMGLSVKRTHNHYALLSTFEDREGVKPLISVIYTPYSSDDQAKRRKFYPDYLPYKMNTISILISTDPSGRCYDKFPAVASDESEATKLQSIHSIEARGNSLRDGFRPKK